MQDIAVSWRQSSTWLDSCQRKISDSNEKAQLYQVYFEQDRSMDSYIETVSLCSNLKNHLCFKKICFYNQSEVIIPKQNVLLISKRHFSYYSESTNYLSYEQFVVLTKKFVKQNNKTLMCTVYIQASRMHYEHKDQVI